MGKKNIIKTIWTITIIIELLVFHPVKSQHKQENYYILFEKTFDISNVNAYYWITDVYNQQYAVPNYLTGRQLNFRILAEF